MNKKFFNGLTTVNIEFTSRCNKSCWMCGGRKLDREHPEMAIKYGDMDFDLIEKIAKQLPDNIIVQLHNNGESLLYPRFKEAAALFENQIRCMDTNANLIVEKADEIIDNLDTLTISTFEKDPDSEKQYSLVKQFLDIRGDRKPNLVYRCLGKVDTERWKDFPGVVVKRVLHDPLGSFGYEKPPTIPETGICLEALSHMAIDRLGNVSFCVRFDPNGLAIIGNANDDLLIDIWNSDKRKEWVQHHIDGRRDKIDICSKCDFWGIPTGQ